jgi:predicted enzyme related to lactoylglutathione lyase
MREKLEFLSAVLLVSRDAPRLAAFYRDVLNVPLEDEKHDETELHYGCTLGDMHFAIHPVGDFQEAQETGVGAVKLAFNVFDLAAFVESVEAKGVHFLYPVKNLGFAKMTALKDPDGNLVEFTELGARWFRMLEERKKNGVDLVARWKARHV